MSRMLQILTRFGLTSLLVFAGASPVLGAGGCEDSVLAGRDRPGNDDIFIFLDSSLSMGPKSFGRYGANNYMEHVRTILGNLADCYIKEGDFVLIATFDGEARIEIAKEIHVDKEKAARDKATLKEQIAALEPTRQRFWDRLPGNKRGPERLGGDVRHVISGGSLKTDLGKMLDLNRRVLEEYASPSHRQLVLLFTDGDHKPADFSEFYKEEITLKNFFPGQKVAHFKFGVIAVPGDDGEIDEALDQVIESFDPDRTWRDAGELKLLKSDPNAGNVSKVLIDQIAELLNMRIDLVEPVSVHLGEAVTPVLDETFRLINNTRLKREIRLVGAFYEGEVGDPRIALQVEPTLLEIEPGGEQSFKVAGKLRDISVGQFSGKIRFEFGDAVAFSPVELPVRGRRVAWIEKYWWLAMILALILVLSTLTAFVLWRKPVWVSLDWTNGESREVSLPKRISVHQSLKFGAMGTGGLQVEGPDSRIGEITRKSVQEFAYAFDYRFLNVKEPPEYGGQSERLNMGVWYPVPGTESEQICIRKAYRRDALERLLNAMNLSPGGGGMDGGPGASPGHGESVPSSSAESGDTSVLEGW